MSHKPNSIAVLLNHVIITVTDVKILVIKVLTKERLNSTTVIVCDKNTVSETKLAVVHLLVGIMRTDLGICGV